MKLSILGGSAPSTVGLFLCSEVQEKLAGVEIALVGRSVQRLNAVARAFDQVCGNLGPAPRLASFEPDALRAALTSSDIVLVQMRCGGYEGRAFDESFPLRYGMCGDEGLGPGGLSAAWRSWPELRVALDAIGDFFREGRSVLQVAVGAEIELPQIERQFALVADDLEEARGLGDDLGADAVTRNDGDELARHGTLFYCTSRWASRAKARRCTGAHAPS